MEKSRQTPSARRIVGMVAGIVIIGLGIALFKQSHLGNDSISALNMRLAEMLGISLGVQNLCTNILFFAVQAAGIRRVVIGSKDPNPLVHGKGIRILREHGVEVTEQVLQDECDIMNGVFSYRERTCRKMRE